MADHDQQYLIELDANKPVAVIFKVSSSLFLCTKSIAISYKLTGMSVLESFCGLYFMLSK